MVNVTFAINFLTSNGTQALYYALCISSNSLDSGANNNIFYMLHGSACNLQTSINVNRVLYVSTTNIYLVAYASLTSPVFYMSSAAPPSITYTRIAFL